jgi:hypothetical protein
MYNGPDRGDDCGCAGAPAIKLDPAGARNFHLLGQATPNIQTPSGDPGRSGVAKPPGEAARRKGRLIPNLLSRHVNVVRFKPSCTAATRLQ